MEKINKKCSAKDHEESNAVSFCPQCKINMCNKCENIHSKLCQYHQPYKLDKDENEIYTGLCNISNHYELLEFFCHTHNKLCCGLCICKIKSNEKGQHSDCDVCKIEDIKEKKEKQYLENLKNLENMSKTIEASIEQLKLIFQKISENKEKTEKSIQTVFTKIRNIINNREEKLLYELNEKYEKIGFKENIIRNSEKLPNKIKVILNNSQLNKEKLNMNSNKEIKVGFLINEYINTENNIKDITEMNEIISKFKDLNNIKFEFFPEKDEDIKQMIDTINKFGEIRENTIDNIFKESLIIKQNKSYIENLKQWLNPLKDFETQLLYRKSRDGDTYKTFHDLCDNQDHNLILIKSKEGFIIGGYTPLKWKSNSYEEGWKEDNETFLFSLTNSKKHPKINNDGSIYCDKDFGPWFAYIGFYKCSNMSKGKFLYKKSDIYFKDINDIIPHENKDKFFDVEEVEVYKLLME